MPLRSSSAPVIGAILSPFSDSPYGGFESVHSQFSDQHNPKLLFSHGVHHHHNLTSFSCNTASPKSHSGITEFNPESNSSTSGNKAIRRAQSDGSLEGLLYSSCDMEEFRSSVTPKKSSYQLNTSMLETAPSFSIFSSENHKFQDDMKRMKDLDQEPLERTITIGDNIESLGGGDFCFGKKGMGLIEEKAEEEEEGFDGIVQPPSPPMYLAAGLGVGGADGFGTHAWDDDFSPENVDESGGNSEEYYERMVDEYPCHPLFLKNYAQALQSKGDFSGAEDYYFRTTLANPSDGEALLQYAKLVWQLRHDQDRASSYFERAAQASPQDSSVLAAYASFLWEIEDDQDEDKACHQSQADEGDMPDTTAAGSKRGDNPEENYKKMIEENPNNALLLRNYAQLCQSKGDLQGAEEYYLQAILADPKDGEIMVQYAKLVWELHRDSRKALTYFERAAQANSEDSYVLAAYAYFLWESGDDEEDRVTQSHIQGPLVQGGAVSTANA